MCWAERVSERIEDAEQPAMGVVNLVRVYRICTNLLVETSKGGCLEAAWRQLGCRQREKSVDMES